MAERLQKLLSQAGIASRRDAERLIIAGRVTVNGLPATLGAQADLAADDVRVDGKRVQRASSLYFLLHKPTGVVVTMERPRARSVHNVSPRTAAQRQALQRQRIVADLLPPELQGKVFPVGRLDADSSGLLLFTNDGELALRLTHPRYDHEKVYDVTIGSALSPDGQRLLETGILLDGVRTKPAGVVRLSPRQLEVTLKEGRNRQLRRMVQAAGCTVLSLHRTRIGPISDPHLAPGKLRPLTSEEVRALRALVDESQPS
jgi:23S rRNA pseudouridine2605 synthase